MNNTQMTLTERNERLYELRQKLIKARAEVAWIEQEIWIVRDQYDRQGRDIYQEMYGEKNTLWDHLDRMSGLS